MLSSASHLKMLSKVNSLRVFFLNRQLIPSRMEYSFQTKPAAVKRSIDQTFVLQNRKPENIRRILNFLNQETNQQSARHFLS